MFELVIFPVFFLCAHGAQLNVPFAARAPSLVIAIFPCFAQLLYKNVRSNGSTEQQLKFWQIKPHVLQHQHCLGCIWLISVLFLPKIDSQNVTTPFWIKEIFHHIQM